MVFGVLINLKAMVFAHHGLKKYDLDGHCNVTAEHHRVGLGPAGKPERLVGHGDGQWEAEHHNRSWVEIEFHEKKEFKGIGFKSAGDHPREAPTEVKIFEHKMIGGWHEIGHHQLDFHLKNHEEIIFPMVHGDTKKVRFEFHNNRGKEGLRLAEIMFYHH